MGAADKEISDEQGLKTNQFLMFGHDHIYAIVLPVVSVPPRT